MHAKLTRKPLDQIATKRNAQCALCKFFLVAKLFHRLNIAYYFNQASHIVNFYKINIGTVSRNRCLFAQVLAKFRPKCGHKNVGLWKNYILTSLLGENRTSKSINTRNFRCRNGVIKLVFESHQKRTRAIFVGKFSRIFGTFLWFF
jgi:hypothetical protein